MFTRFKQNTNSFKLYIFNNKNYMSLEANTGEKKKKWVLGHKGRFILLNCRDN